ncbi:hypothetical protein [Mangrovihabitans endophyticus]|uniref:Transmembrane protein n=1 Tax=Mangrovihabitans endophyticus TaxID=1751298 RepID=A0A8J3C5K5_9ACTN|nr:hypothetical protein [Mangrovihabitans endophyticus]GGL12658.1 hypothetical protein GCM10012284_54180 [Mangrovihabitans endophyticus]
MSSIAFAVPGLRTLAAGLLLLAAAVVLQGAGLVAAPGHRAGSLWWQAGSLALAGVGTLTVLGGLLHTRIRVRELVQRLEQPIVVAVVEWQSDRGEDPAVVVGDSVPGVQRPVAALLARLAGDGALNYVDDAWVAEHPRPDLGDPAAVAEYLDAVREQTTDAWVTLYGPVGSRAPGAFLLTYHDVRADRPDK